MVIIDIGHMTAQHSSSFQKDEGRRSYDGIMSLIDVSWSVRAVVFWK
jgi:hypothetical protein